MKTPLIRKNTCREIVVGQFGMQKALASYDVMGNICFYHIDVEAELFFEKKGPGVIASIIENDLWFDIALTNGIFESRSPQTAYVVRAFESEPGADSETSRFVTYSNERRVILRRRKEETRPLCSQNLRELALLAQGFAMSFRKLGCPRAPAAVPSPPFIILPRTPKLSCQDFSKDLVLLQ